MDTDLSDGVVDVVAVVVVGTVGTGRDAGVVDAGTGAGATGEEVVATTG